MQTERDFIHDVLNPMTIIDGRLKMLQKKIEAAENIDEKIKLDVEKIQAAFDKTLALIKARREQNRNE